MAEVMMPRLGVSVTEGTLSTWLKAVGDTVEVGEAICEVSTDKVDTEIESTVAGTVTEHLFAEGDTVPVGQPLALVRGTDEEDASPPPPQPAGQPVAESPPAEVARTAEPATGGTAETEVEEPAGSTSLVQGSVLMPHLGVSVTEATVSVWLKAVGDTVEVGEAICEVSTDKVDTEIESTVAGILAEQRYADGETVAVGEPLAVVTATGELPPEEMPQSTSSVRDDRAGGERSSMQTPAPEPATTVPGEPARTVAAPFDHDVAVRRLVQIIARSGRPAASPAARRRAAELGTDIRTVTGHGAGGHVTREDVERHAASADPGPARPAQEFAQKAPSALVTTEPSQSPGGIPPGYEDVAYDETPTSRIRQVTAEHMSRSRRTAAHMTTEVDVDLGRLTAVRAELNQRRLADDREKLSFLPFVARATCAALMGHRDLNATFDMERLLRWREVNLGIAVDTPRGLMVPVVRGAERMTVETLGRAIADAAGRARAGTAGLDDFRAGTFTISNPGSVGAVSAPAIINQPQVGILGMPTIVRRPWVVTLPDGQETIAIRPIIRLALTFDHRAVDGAEATRCLVDVKRRLEAWDVDDYR